MVYFFKCHNGIVVMFLKPNNPYLLEMCTETNTDLEFA